jgi:predicted ATP-dependent endonuclease of OLD family
LKGKVKEWFEENRSRFKHQIDSRIFFGRCIILTEGESDKNLLGIAHYLESNDSSLDLEGNDIVITSIGGKYNFDKYIKLLQGFGILYVILADSDARSLFSSPGSLTKEALLEAMM